MEKKISKLVIPAAGLGTRMLPATKVVPKELLPIVDRPAIQYIVEEAVNSGIKEIIFVISPDKNQVVQHFQSSPDLEAALNKKGDQALLSSLARIQSMAKITVVYQEKPLGLGHAVLCAKEAVGDEWFFVSLPDDLIDSDIPCVQQMLNSWQENSTPLVAVMEVPWEDVGKYGVVKAIPISEGLGKVESVVEKPKRDVAPSNLAIIGRYLLPSSIFKLLEQVKPGAIGEIQLTDALLNLVSTEGMHAFQFQGDRYDVGNKFGFLEANMEYALKNEELKSPMLELIKLMADSR